jgi:hypothetical protein
MILGLLCNAKKKPALALPQLTKARRIIEQTAATPMLAGVALAELA